MTIMAAPAAGGKSQACIAWLLERLRPAWRVQQVPEAALIAPNRLLRSHLRRRLQQQASIGITIADFAEVCQALIAAGGRPYRLAQRPLVRQLIAQAMIACAREQLAQGRTSSLSPTRGVIDLVDAAIADLKHGLVTPDAVHAVADDPLTAELAMIYRHYQHRLEQAGLEDRAGLLWRAIQALHDPACRIPWATIAVDGFDSFLPAQRALLARLAERAEVFVTVPWSATTATMPQRVAHGRFATTRERLGATCRDATYQELRDSRLAPLLDRIERTLFEPMPPHETTRASPQPLTDAGAPCALWQLETRAAEVREVLREIAWLRTCHRWRAAECAIVVTDIAGYRPWLEDIAREMGVPLAFTTGLAADRLPAISAVLLMLDVARATPGDAALRSWLASPFFTTPFSPEEREQLAAAVGVRHAPGEDAAMLALRERMRQHREQVVPTATPRPLVGWLAWLDGQLQAWAWRPGGAHQAWCRIVATLRSMTGPGDMPPLSYDQFAELVRATAAAPITGDQPADAVCVAPLAGVRGARWRLVAVIGVAEGLVSDAPQANPLLGTALRQRLGLDVPAPGDSLSQWLQAFTRADQRLIVTRPQRADDGSACPPAHAWDALVAASGLEPVCCGPPPLAHAASLAELHAEAARQGATPPDDSRHRLRHAAIAIGHATLAARQRAMDPLNGDAAALAPLLTARYGPHHVWSASRLERYGSCPQLFFAASVLALADSAADDSHRERGRLMHDILSDAAQAAIELATSPQQQLAGAAQRVLAVYRARTPLPAAVWHWHAFHVTRALEQLLARLEREAGEWSVLAVEVGFREQVRWGDGTAIWLRGAIDRVEQHAGGGLRVIDFKSSVPQVIHDPARNRHQLQLPLYALAARQIFDRPVHNAAYRSMSDGELRWLAKQGHTLDTALATAQQHVAEITAGIRAGAFPAEPPAAGCPAWCPARAWCWRFTPGRF